MSLLFFSGVLGSFVWVFFTLHVLAWMHSKQRHAVVQDKDPLAAGEQQEAYRWVPCPRKTKIARRQTGLQRISRAGLNT